MHLPTPLPRIEKNGSKLLLQMFINICLIKTGHPPIWIIPKFVAVIMQNARIDFNNKQSALLHCLLPLQDIGLVPVSLKSTIHLHFIDATDNCGQLCRCLHDFFIRLLPNQSNQPCGAYESWYLLSLS